MPMHYDSDFHAWIDDEAQPPQPPQDPSYGLNGMDAFPKLKANASQNTSKRQDRIPKPVGCILMSPALIVLFILMVPKIVPFLTWETLVQMAIVCLFFVGLFIVTSGH